MKKSLVFVLLLAFISMNAQTFKEDIEIDGHNFRVTSTKNNLGSFTIGVGLKSNETPKEFSLSPLRLEPFVSIFTSKAVEEQTDLSVNESNKAAKELFYKIMADVLNENSTYAPVSGTLKVNDTTSLFKFTIDSEKKALITKHEETDKHEVHKEDCDYKPPKFIKIGYIKIKDISIEFLEGFAEIVVVDGIVEIDRLYRKNLLSFIHGGELRFNNQYGIGFSTKKNFSTLNWTRLFDNVRDDADTFIKLGGVISYKENTRPLTRDYSPRNQVLDTYGGQETVLKKDESNKLFEIIVFSDFLGVEQDNPNGLVQLEFAKRINFNHTRKQSAKFLSDIFKGWGVLQYIRPAVTISKIEENNRFLIPESNHEIVGAGNEREIKTELKTTPISLLNYQRLSIGLDINLLFLENAELKSHLYLDGGYRYGRTSIRDSLVSINEMNMVEVNERLDDFGVGYHTYFLKGSLQLLPEERFSLMISYSPQYITPAFSKPKLSSIDRKLDEETPYQRWVNTFELYSYVKLSEKGKLFARYRFNHQRNNVESNFHQFQLGYSFYLFSKRNTKP